MNDNVRSTSTGNSVNLSNTVVPQAVPDTTVIVDEPCTTKRTNEDKVCIGILYCKQDAEVATRFKAKFESFDVKALRFHDDYTPPPGDPKVDEIADFGQHCDAFIWLATENSIKNDMMDHYRAVCHHRALTRQDKIFMCGIASENQNINLPATLDAYTPIIEDDRFTQCVQSTVNWLLQKKSNSQDVAGTSQQQKRPVEHTTASLHPCQPVSHQLAMQQNDNKTDLIQFGEAAQPTNYTIHLNNAVITNLQLGGESNYIEHGIDAKSKATEFDAATSRDYKCEKQSADMEVSGDDPSNTTLQKEGDSCNSPEPTGQA